MFTLNTLLVVLLQSSQNQTKCSLFYPVLVQQMNPVEDEKCSKSSSLKDLPDHRPDYLTTKSVTMIYFHSQVAMRFLFEL